MNFRPPSSWKTWNLKQRDVWSHCFFLEEADFSGILAFVFAKVYGSYWHFLPIFVLFLPVHK